MTTVQLSSLQHMEGYPFSVLFSPGAQTRAKRVAARCERAHHYLKSVLGFGPKPCLLVLSPEAWPEYAAVQIYGMPHYAPEGEIFFGATTADFFHAITRMLDDVLTSEQRAEMEAFYGTVDGEIDIAPFADLLVVHELAHLFHEQIPFAFPRLWLMEIFTNLCLHAYVAEAEPAHLPVLTIPPERMTSLPTKRIQHRSLEDFERLYVGVGPEKNGWYQCRFHAAARDVYDEAGVDALRCLYRTFATREGGLTDGQLATLLEEQVHPTVAQVMREWPDRGEPSTKQKIS